MNSLELVQSSPRNRSLFIVEGNFEKNVLFRLISKLYPELSIDFDNVWIYETNIYNLYETIKNYYETDNWEEEDVDLPFILSEKKVNQNVEKMNLLLLSLYLTMKDKTRTFR